MQLAGYRASDAREEAAVSDRSWGILAVTVGAVVGGLAGYLLLTEHGRTVRRQIDRVLDEASEELGQFRGTRQKAAEVGSEAWQLLNDSLGEDAGPSAARRAGARRTSPF
jgi:hypothetical protein